MENPDAFTLNFLVFGSSRPERVIRFVRHRTSAVKSCGQHAESMIGWGTTLWMQAVIVRLISGYSLVSIMLPFMHSE